ncbi:MAG: tRNA-binding protein [candidate division Zixibacteria bacterium]|nr:tRNA-binding protein [candidate division Zixibacteria bacterium]
MTKKLYNDFEKVDVRVGKIIKVEEPEGLRINAYKLTIDFGKEIGQKISLAQITKNYTKKDLMNRLVMGVVNLSPKEIGNYTSEALTLGFTDKNGGVVLAIPDKDAPLGTKMY